MPPANAADGHDGLYPAAQQKVTPLVSPASPVWLTSKEAAKYLKVEPRTLLLWTRQGKVKGYRLSGTRRHVWRYRHPDLDAMLAVPSVALPKRRVE